MQVFIPYQSPIDVAKCLDTKRINKQIIEVTQILKVYKGKSSAWKNHPVVKMYKPHQEWLKLYLNCLRYYKDNNINKAKYYSDKADEIIPDFISEELCNQHKRRLYTKDPDFYKEFKELGKSLVNYYVIDRVTIGYNNGKIVLRKLK